jgi:hypothetical protein
MAVKLHKPNVVTAIAAACWALWGVLHIWVGYEGTVQFLSKDAPTSQWNMLIGGANVPKSAFQHSKDILPRGVKDFSKYYSGIGPTALAHKHLNLNFALDVSGYGFLGLLVAYMIHYKGSWLFYLMGGLLIGLCDIAFMTLMVYPGQVIELNAGTVGGPVLWILAMIISPFGLPEFNLNELEPPSTGNRKTA